MADGGLWASKLSRKYEVPPQTHRTSKHHVTALFCFKIQQAGKKEYKEVVQRA
jgi:hypothetical protein